MEDDTQVQTTLCCAWWDFLVHNFLNFRGHRCSRQVCFLTTPRSKCHINVLLGLMSKMKGEKHWIHWAVSLHHSYFNMPHCRRISLVTAFFVFKRNTGGNELDMFWFVNSQKGRSMWLNLKDGELWVVGRTVLPFTQRRGTCTSTLTLGAELTGELGDGFLRLPCWRTEHRASKIRRSHLI